MPSRIKIGIVHFCWIDLKHVSGLLEGFSLLKFNKSHLKIVITIMQYHHNSNLRLLSSHKLLLKLKQSISIHYQKLKLLISHQVTKKFQCRKKVKVVRESLWVQFHFWMILPWQFMRETYSKTLKVTKSFWI